ncbi:CLUMA_CG000096, isoform A [Clunio marinus]|uniref:CLUMA_CG000096, isoform A n=1 Tax=Clunio marinus TaxID=568069 RepID=A0A1J1HF60_9DIPT|nr:CLUMA_CG000096, isoform A [Clunio marinus]
MLSSVPNENYISLKEVRKLFTNSKLPSQFVRNYSKKMNESPDESTSMVAKQKKFIHVQTQHGCPETADEENIVILTTSFSPVRESSEEVVWHEEIAEEDENGKVMGSTVKNVHEPSNHYNITKLEKKS